MFKKFEISLSTKNLVMVRLDKNSNNYSNTVLQY